MAMARTKPGWGSITWSVTARTFTFCLLGLILSSMDQAMFAYATPGIMREFHVGLTPIGWILAGSFALASVTVVGCGVITDAIGRKRMFIILLCLSALFVGLHALATTLPLLGILRALGFSLG